MTLVKDVVDSDVGEFFQSCTGTNFVHITCCFCSAATSLEQQLSCVQEGFSIAVDALVVVVIQVLGGRTVLIIGTLWTILSVPDVRVLITLGIGVAAHIPAGDIATQVVIGIHIVSLHTHG